MRQLSPVAARATLARETAEVFLPCLVISGPGLETVRLVHNLTPIVRGGRTFQPYSFDAVPPEDTETASPTLELRIDNVDREVTRLIRDYAGVPSCVIDWVLASDPDNVVYGPFSFAVLSAEYDELVISVNLGYEEDFLNQSVPAQSYNPINSAGLFV